MEGQAVISNLDLYAQAGKNAAYSVVRTGDVNDGELNIEFVSRVNNAQLCGLHVQPASLGSGLSASYYNTVDLSGPALLRTDERVDFNWGQGSPDPGIEGETFSARWTGQVLAEHTQAYTFYTTTDDGVRLWVNNRLLIDQWNDHSSTEHLATVNLVAGEKYSLRLEYYENTVEARVQLAWSGAAQTWQVIPATRLYPAPDGATAWRAGNQPEGEPTGFTIRPNPANDVLTLTLTEVNPLTLELRLTNVLAQPVRFGWEAGREPNQRVLRVGHLPNGLYLLGVRQGSRWLTRKVVIAH